MSLTAVFFLLWYLLAAGLGVVWTVRLIAVRSAAGRRRILTPRAYDGPPPRTPKVSVILAAKDEESHVEPCVRSLLAQDYPDYELIVVDDRSHDRTPQILERLAREAPDGLRVVTVTELRDGWFGKNNAMREGVAAASGDWLMFTDADCRFMSPRALGVAMHEALAHQADLLSVTPVLEAPTVWERIIQPVCALVLILWFLPERVNDPAKKTAYANGAFMLMTRDCYQTVGGHERVRTELNEDIQMARLAKRAGFDLRVVENEDLYVTRMYPTFAAAWRGWSRIFCGSLQTLRRLFIAIGLLLLFTVTPWVSLIVAAAGSAVSDQHRAGFWLASLLLWSGVVFMLQAVTWRLYGMLRVAPPWSVTYFLGALMVLSMLAGAVLKAVGATSTTWRGTAYRAHRRVPVPADSRRRRAATPDESGSPTPIHVREETVPRA